LQLDVTVLNPVQVVFKGKADSVILPGEEGVFEIAPYHKPILSRLVSGIVQVDQEGFTIRRGVVKAGKNSVIMIVEE